MKSFKTVRNFKKQLNNFDSSPITLTNIFNNLCPKLEDFFESEKSDF